MDMCATNGVELIFATERNASSMARVSTSDTEQKMPLAKKYQESGSFSNFPWEDPVAEQERESAYPEDEECGRIDGKLVRHSDLLVRFSRKSNRRSPATRVPPVRLRRFVHVDTSPVASAGRPGRR